jgi:hypothetical protein
VVRLWDRHLQKPDASPYLVYRAAQFFSAYDKPRAERLILRGLAMDPQSEALKARMPSHFASYSWPEQGVPLRRGVGRLARVPHPDAAG